MLYLFDLDGTIVVRYSTTLLVGVRSWFDALDWSQNRVGFVTNQGGVHLHLHYLKMGGGDFNRYPTMEDVSERLSAIESELIPLEHRDKYYRTCCYLYLDRNGQSLPIPDFGLGKPEWNPYNRKPNPGMLFDQLRWHGVGAEGAIYVGDMETDRVAAEEAGILFCEASNFWNNQSQQG